MRSSRLTSAIATDRSTESEIAGAHLLGEARRLAFPDDARVLEQVHAVRMRQRERHVLLAQQHRDRRALRSRSSALESCSRITGARPSVGSSRMSSFGCIISARAIASICCSPPDSVFATWPWRASQDREQLEQPRELLGARFRRRDAGRPDRGSRAPSCRRTARASPGIARRRRARSRPASCRLESRSPKRMVPVYGTSPEIALNSVVLPAPLRPTIETNSPSRTSSVTLSSACALPYSTLTSRTSSSAGFAPLRAPRGARTLRACRRDTRGAPSRCASPRRRCLRRLSRRGTSRARDPPAPRRSSRCDRRAAPRAPRRAAPRIKSENAPISPAVSPANGSSMSTTLGSRAIAFAISMRRRSANGSVAGWRCITAPRPTASRSRARARRRRARRRAAAASRAAARA